MSSTDQLRAVSRSAQVGVGLAVSAVALFFLVFGVWGYVAEFRQPSDEKTLLIAATAFTLVGSSCGLLGWRLLTGRRRHRDGGLFSPGALRMWALVFALSPILAFFTRPLDLVWTLFHLGAAAACLELARRRETYLHADRPSGGTV
jgi:hypothetical protein